MDANAIYAKTTRGKRALVKKLPKTAGFVLPEIDGNTSLGTILSRLDRLETVDLDEAVNWLIEGGFIKPVVQDPFSDSAWDVALSHNAVEVDEIGLDQFTVTDKTARAKKQEKPLSNEEQEKLKALEQADAEARERAEAALKAKLEAENPNQAEEQRVVSEKAAAEKRKEEERAKEKEEAEQRAKEKEEVEERARLEAEEKAKEEARKLAEAEEKAQAEAEENARKEAAAKLRAEEKAAEEQREAEEKAAAEKRKEEEKARKKEEAEQRAKEKEEAKEKARLEAAVKKEEKARLRADKKAEAEQRKAEKAEAKAIAKEEAAAKKAERKAEAEKRAQERRLAKEQAKQDKAEEDLFTIDEVEQYLSGTKEEETAKKKSVVLPVKAWLTSFVKNIKPLSIYAIAVLFLLIFAAQFINFHIWTNAIEKIAEQHIQDDVNIKSVRISYFPKPHLLLEDLTIANSSSITAKKIDVYPDLLNLKEKLFGGSKAPYEIKSIEIDGFELAQKDLHRIASWQGASSRDQQLKLGRIVLSNMAIQLNRIELPNINGNILLNEVGRLKSAEFFTEANNLTAKVKQIEQRYIIDIDAFRWRSPIAPYPIFSELKASATVKDNQLVFSNISGILYNGQLAASLNMDLASDTLATKGKFELNDFFIADMAEELKVNNVVEGKLSSKGAFSFNVYKPTNHFVNGTLASTFSIKNGYLKTVDLTEAMRSGNLSGHTKFTTLTGHAALANKQYRFTKLLLRENQLSARGYLTLADDHRVSGVINSSIAVNRSPINARLAIGGPLHSLKLRK